MCIACTRPSSRPTTNARPRRAQCAFVAEDPQRGEQQHLDRDLGRAVVCERTCGISRASLEVAPRAASRLAEESDREQIEGQQGEPAQDRHRREHQPVAAEVLRFGEHRRKHVREVELEVPAGCFIPVEVAITAGLCANGPTNGWRLSVPCVAIHLPALRYNPPSRFTSRAARRSRRSTSWRSPRRPPRAPRRREQTGGLAFDRQQRPGALVQRDDGHEPEQEHQPRLVNAQIGQQEADRAEAGEGEGADEREDPHPPRLVYVTHVAPADPGNSPLQPCPNGENRTRGGVVPKVVVSEVYGSGSDSERIAIALETWGLSSRLGALRRLVRDRGCRRDRRDVTLIRHRGRMARI